MNRIMVFSCVACVNVLAFGRTQYLNYGNATWTFDDTTYTGQTSVNITGVSIPDSATEVTMPASVSIGARSYSVSLGASVTGGRNLVTFNVPANASGIAANRFRVCDNLRYINIASAHETLSSLDGVVYDKSGKGLRVVPNAVTEFVVSAGVTNVLGTAFSNCMGMQAVNVEDGNEWFSSVDGVLYNKAITELVACPGGKESVTIPDTVTDIVASAFSGKTNLYAVVLPAGVTRIGSSAFSGCTGLAEIAFPDGVTDIGNSAFSGCTGLSRIILPESVTNIAMHAFYGCTGLSEVVLPSKIDAVGTDAFRGCEWIRKVTIPQYLCATNEMRNLFPYPSRITDATIAEGTTTIGKSLFVDCTGLENLTIPDSVTSISTDAFKDCDKLASKLYVQQVKGVFGPEAGTAVRYALGDVVQDRTIVSVTVDSDCAIDEFVLTDGKVYDCAVRIVNTADAAVQISLPSGYVYESFVGAAPLTLPPHSTNMLTITRTGDRTFLVARRQLQPIGQ